jgi:hypothetical protein
LADFGLLTSLGLAGKAPLNQYFGDAPRSHAFYGYVETAYDHAIIRWYADGTFRQSNSASRGQICKIV